LRPLGVCSSALLPTVGPELVAIRSARGSRLEGPELFGFGPLNKTARNLQLQNNE
jgi:hypothetical protein